eukprot:GHVP01038603.1.p1 GENE.GHVP01038603.1~~GHVP01038603.1.p1  ORF type:complete len:392 (+),score=53.45 GHVP01038603.1:25-1176(+)
MKFTAARFRYLLTLTSFRNKVTKRLNIYTGENCRLNESLQIMNFFYFSISTAFRLQFHLSSLPMPHSSFFEIQQLIQKSDLRRYVQKMSENRIQYFVDDDEDIYFSPLEKRNVPSLASVQPNYHSDSFDFNDAFIDTPVANYSSSKVRFQEVPSFPSSANTNYTQQSSARPIIGGTYHGPTSKSSTVKPAVETKAITSPIMLQPLIKAPNSSNTYNQTSRFDFSEKNYSSPITTNNRFPAVRQRSTPTSILKHRTYKSLGPNTTSSYNFQNENYGQNHDTFYSRSSPTSFQKHRTYKTLAPSGTSNFRNENKNQVDDTFYYRRQHQRIPPYAEGDNPMRRKILECLADKYNVSLKNSNHSSVPDLENWRVKPTVDLRYKIRSI